MCPYGPCACGLANIFSLVFAPDDVYVYIYFPCVPIVCAEFKADSDDVDVMTRVVVVADHYIL